LPAGNSNINIKKPTGKRNFAIWQKMGNSKTKLEEELLSHCLKLLEADAKLRNESEVAKDFKLAPSTVGRWLKRERSISLSNVLAILEKYGTEISFKTNIEIKETPPPIIQIQNVPRFETFAETFAMESYIPIRILDGAAAAGHPREVDEGSVRGWALIYASREWMPNDPANYTCVHVIGSSMAPILQDGDIVAVDHGIKDPAILDKKMAVFRVNGGITIKWLKYFPEKALVVGVPENKDEFDTVITLKADEINEGIVGKVAWWWAKR
jgi:phage repressor protein C with HTH and peptisase S24 domain